MRSSGIVIRGRERCGENLLLDPAVKSNKKATSHFVKVLASFVVFSRKRMCLGGNWYQTGLCHGVVLFVVTTPSQYTPTSQHLHNRGNGWWWLSRWSKAKPLDLGPVEEEEEEEGVTLEYRRFYLIYLDILFVLVLYLPPSSI